MKRRVLIKILVGAAATPTLLTAPSRGQQPHRRRVVGVLVPFAGSDPAVQSWLAAFRDALTNLGWSEGRNLWIELRWADPAGIRVFAKELVDFQPDALLGLTTPVIAALAGETRTIPIVFAIVSDPIGNDFAANLNYPGGNITGFTNIESTMGGKWMGLLKEIAPRTTRVALLFNPATAAPIKFFMPSIQAAAASFAVQASAAPVHAKEEIETIIAAQAHDPGGGLIALPDPFNVANSDLMIALANRYSIPAIYSATEAARSGGLIAYGVDFIESLRQAAGYIDHILRGAKPADLPIQNPTKFNLVVNLKTAKRLGLSVPLTLQTGADELIE
jgi:putative ABC transport system substrate-binding protein